MLPILKLYLNELFVYKETNKLNRFLTANQAT
jgi:hypothetical protein